MRARRVVVVSPVTDRFNVNWELRAYLLEGFASICGAESAIAVTATQAPVEIERFKPDLVIAFGSTMLESADLLRLRRAADRAGAHFAAWLHDDPYEIDYAGRASAVADTIFSNDAGSVAYYRRSRVFHLPLAASPTAHYRPVSETFDYDLFFCGYGFSNRIALFEDAADAGLERFRTLVVGSGWPASRSFFANRRVPNASIADYYAASACTIVLGRALDLGNDRYRVTQSTPGPRLFEAAMAGCAQLYLVTGLEVLDYFQAESELVLVDGPDEIPEQIRSLTQTPARAHQLRRAAQERALRDHTYAARAKTIIERCFESE